ncbi:MAG: hypothetical protein K0M70_02640 [Arenimonas sp.]|uniref:hypothetical protein n=1 Tax=Arenimonas sp. TaxID=1872635 RepID=UPI0025BC73DB|nr:hypothetical protein [Arenimonas sp.]MBW8366738.1 hypothetical protein [Arenimonas sp.]
MRKELIDELRQRHPRLLGPTGEPATQPSILCGDGWFNLLDCLCGAVQAGADAKGNEDVRVEEIKSKYGSLRFEAYGLSPAEDAQVALAEALSERTCEECGAPGSERGRDGWVSTLCSNNSAHS